MFPTWHIEAFLHAIIAVIITIMVLDLRVRTNESPTDLCRRTCVDRRTRAGLFHAQPACGLGARLADQNCAKEYVGLTKGPAWRVKSRPSGGCRGTGLD
jgi:hypothetical protein